MLVNDEMVHSHIAQLRVPSMLYLHFFLSLF